MNTHHLAMIIAIIFAGLSALAAWTAIYGRGRKRRQAALAVLSLLLRRRS